MTASVSVVVPCFRCAATIRRAVESVERQTIRPAELILVDDGSRDGTPDVLGELQAEYGTSWIQIIGASRNQGPAVARNLGWDAASGNFIAFLDADDSWHPQKIELQYGFLASHPEVVLCGHRTRLFDDVAAGRTMRGPISATSISRRQLLVRNQFATPSAMILRSVPHRFRSTKRYAEDHLLWMEVVCSGRRVARLEATLAFIYKAVFGEAGLSAHLVRSQLGELGNYWTLYRTGHVAFTTATALSALSVMKFTRRLAIAGLRRGSSRLATTQRTQSVPSVPEARARRPPVGI